MGSLPPPRFPRKTFAQSEADWQRKLDQAAAKIRPPVIKPVLKPAVPQAAQGVSASASQTTTLKVPKLVFRAEK